MTLSLLITLACGTHIAVDAAIFGAPVGMVVLTILALNRWGPTED
jgi:hypothetical protein